VNNHECVTLPKSKMAGFTKQNLRFVMVHKLKLRTDCSVVSLPIRYSTNCIVTVYIHDAVYYIKL
jgi:hypothetical protein